MILETIINGSSIGSYVVIKPIENVGIYRGRVIKESFNKHFNKMDIVYYLEEDAHIVSLEGETIHLVLHYHIITNETKSKEFKEKIKIEEEIIKNRFDNNIFAGFMM